MARCRPAAWHNTKRVRFIPIKDGDLLELNATTVPGAKTTDFAYLAQRDFPHTVIGFKAAPGTRVAGWLVVLVDETAEKRTLPVKHRDPVRLRAAV
jgi:hypothetical protein